jgi:hypothetical protein
MTYEWTRNNTPGLHFFRAVSYEIRRRVVCEICSDVSGETAASFIRFICPDEIGRRSHYNAGTFLSNYTASQFIIA